MMLNEITQATLQNLQYFWNTKTHMCSTKVFIAFLIVLIFCPATLKTKK